MSSMSKTRVSQPGGRALIRPRRQPTRYLVPIRELTAAQRKRWRLRGLSGPGTLAGADTKRTSSGIALVEAPAPNCRDHAGRRHRVAPRVDQFRDDRDNLLEAHSWYAGPGVPGADRTGRACAWYYLSTQPVTADPGDQIDGRYTMTAARKNTKANTAKSKSTQPKAESQRKPRGVRLLGHPLREVAVWIGANVDGATYEEAAAALRELVEAEGGEYGAAKSSIVTYLKDGRLVDAPAPDGWERFKPAQLSKRAAGSVRAALKRARKALAS